MNTYHAYVSDDGRVRVPETGEKLEARWIEAVPAPPPEPVSWDSAGVAGESGGGWTSRLYRLEEFRGPAGLSSNDVKRLAERHFNEAV